MDKGLSAKISNYVDIHQDDLFAELVHLIQFDTQNRITYGQETECQIHIKNRFAEEGLDVDFYTLTDVENLVDHPEFLAGRGAENRQNVCASLVGQIPTKIMISAHTDTMPYGELENWTVDPFGGLIRDQKIFGLGSNDNKYGIALLIFLAKMFKELNIKPYYSYDFLAYVDEEYGGGNGALAGSLKETYETTISLDSGNYELWTAAIGGCGFLLDIHVSHPVDSSKLVLEAIFAIKQELDQFAKLRHQELKANPLYVGTDVERAAFRYFDVSAGGLATDLNKGHIRFSFYTDKSKEISVGELNSYIDRARKKVSDQIIISDPVPFHRYFHYLETNPDSDALLHMKACAERFSQDTIEYKGACMSDLSLFLKCASEDSFGFGIMRDFSLYGGAHQPDEFVDCEEFKNITKAVAIFIATYQKNNQI